MSDNIVGCGVLHAAVCRVHVNGSEFQALSFRFFLVYSDHVWCVAGRPAGAPEHQLLTSPWGPTVQPQDQQGGMHSKVQKLEQDPSVFMGFGWFSSLR